MEKLCRYSWHFVVNDKPVNYFWNLKQMEQVLIVILFQKLYILSTLDVFRDKEDL